jgi:hypothetical protein
MSSPRGLPPGWTREFSKSQNREYFYHAATNTSKWKLSDVLPPFSASTTALKRTEASASADGAVVGAGKRLALEQQQPRLAVVVPYRDDARHVRRTQLEKFAPHMNTFLAEHAKLDVFKLFIIEQGDSRKFNRGKLLNIGFTLGCKEGFDTFVFHDVDLLPQPRLAPYYARPPASGPVHIAKCWSRYNKNPEYLGGIVSFSRADFERIGGFPNIYWCARCVCVCPCACGRAELTRCWRLTLAWLRGWGGEDDELKKRVDFAGLFVSGPPQDLEDAIEDLEHKSLEQKLAELRTRRDEKCNVKWEVNAAHDEIREHASKPKWWGLPVHFVESARDEAAFAHCAVVTVDMGLNFDVDGSGHWSNDKF